MSNNKVISTGRTSWQIRGVKRALNGKSKRTVRIRSTKVHIQSNTRIVFFGLTHGKNGRGINF